jgi:rhodanese-related sulfurtransferase
MKIKYILPAVILLLLAFMTLILPERDNTGELDPQDLLTEIIDPARYLTTDQVAHRLVNEDPSLFLVDVRPSSSYKKFSLPGAVNVPLEDILAESNQDFFTQPGKDVVLFSNADIFADQAWILLSRMERENIYVLNGGINEWFRTIINPSPPAPTEPKEAFARYQFRLGARQYFLGGSSIEVPEIQAEEIQVTRKKKKSVVEGGC